MARFLIRLAQGTDSPDATTLRDRAVVALGGLAYNARSEASQPLPRCGRVNAIVAVAGLPAGRNSPARGKGETRAGPRGADVGRRWRPALKRPYPAHGSSRRAGSLGAVFRRRVEE